MNQDSIKKILKDNGLKVTQSRIEVFNLLTAAREPLSIEAIFATLPIKMNKTTLYRILRTYADKGLIYQTDFRDGKAYFEFQDKHHHHITCTQCGVREDIDSCTIDTLMPRVSQETKKFAIVNSHSLEFFGICKKCSL